MEAWSSLLTKALLKAFLAMLIVYAPLIGVLKDLIAICYFSKHVLSFLGIVLVFIRMLLQRELFKCLSDGLVVGIASNAQCVVAVRVCQHKGKSYTEYK
jgi:hypothetical protein